MSNSSVPTVVIIGGGVSGTLVAAALLDAHSPLDVVVVESRPSLGRGLAYSTPCAGHLMNVPAGKLSLVEGEPNHLVKWLRANWERGAAGKSFIPRHIFGRYVGDFLSARLAQAEPGVKLRHLRKEAVNLVWKEPGWAVHFADGSRMKAAAVVLATGNPPPPEDVVPAGEFRESANYFPSLWEPGATKDLPVDAAVLLIGSGLTAVDAAISLDANGHRGDVYMISRRGLFPRHHSERSAREAPDDWQPPLPHTLRGLLAQVRRRARLHQRRSGGKFDTGWRRVIDALRDQTPSLWQGLTEIEQRRFLRHLRPFWEVHRHRMAPEVAEEIARFRKEGRLHTLAAWIRRIESYPDGAWVDYVHRPGGHGSWLKVARVINCAGSETDYRKLKRPLGTNLFASGIVEPGPHGMGLRTSSDGELESAQGHTWPNLVTLGPTRLGSLWETTAVPEIRVQADLLAKLLRARLEPATSSAVVIEESLLLLR